METIELSIPHTYLISGMTCDKCAAIVQNKLSAVNGVSSVNVNLETQEAAITFDKVIEISTLHDALSDTVYTISEFPT